MAEIEVPPGQLMAMRLNKLADEIDLLWETFHLPQFSPGEADLVRAAAEIVGADDDGDPEADFGTRRILRTSDADLDAMAYDATEQLAEPGRRS